MRTSRVQLDRHCGDGINRTKQDGPYAQHGRECAGLLSLGLASGCYQRVGEQ